MNSGGGRERPRRNGLVPVVQSTLIFYVCFSGSVYSYQFSGWPDTNQCSVVVTERLNSSILLTICDLYAKVKVFEMYRINKVFRYRLLLNCGPLSEKTSFGSPYLKTQSAAKAFGNVKYGGVFQRNTCVSFVKNIDHHEDKSIDRLRLPQQT